MSAEAPALPTNESAAASPAAPPEVSVRRERPRDRLKSLASSVFVWLLYVPHFTVLKALGPCYGMAWARLVARLHWLMTFLGMQRATRENFVRLREHFRTDASVRTMLRKHLELKHETFARVRVYHQHGIDRCGLRWKLSPRGADALREAVQTERGLLIIGFHFNLFEMTAPVFDQLLPGLETVQLKLRHSHNLEQLTDNVADVAINRAIEADRKSGAKIFYLDDEKSVRPVLRMLRAGKGVAIAADGTYFL